MMGRADERDEKHALRSVATAQIIVVVRPASHGHQHVFRWHGVDSLAKLFEPPLAAEEHALIEYNALASQTRQQVVQRLLHVCRQRSVIVCVGHIELVGQHGGQTVESEHAARQLGAVVLAAHHTVSLAHGTGEVERGTEQAVLPVGHGAGELQRMEDDAVVVCQAVEQAERLAVEQPHAVL